MTSVTKALTDRITKAAESYDANEVERASSELVNHIHQNIATHPASLVEELRVVCLAFDQQGALDLCHKLIENLRARDKAYPFDEADAILNILRRKRYFDLIVQVADVFIQTGQDQPKIRRQYAQALIDLGHLSAGLDVLRKLERDCRELGNSKELAEARGLKGRARKQMYLDAAAANAKPGETLRESLLKAVSDYGDVYQEDSAKVWHGINTVALLMRAKQDGIELGEGMPNSITIAKKILKRITGQKATNLWDCATAAEACLALHDYSLALEWITKYTQDNEYADAFEYASTLRQFEEVWQLDQQKKEHAQIIHLLRAALLRQEGGRLEIESPAQNLKSAIALENDKEFEQILGKDRYKSFQWYRTGLERAMGVAQIRDRNNNGVGTGFLLRGAEVHESFGSDLVLVTNAHVISDDPAEQSLEPGSLPSDEVKIYFEAQDPTASFEVAEVLFSSPRTKLDCTIVRLTSSVDLENPYPIAKRLPLPNKNQRVFVIGHPRGGGLSYSIDDNLLLDHEKPLVHYRAPTEGGSSGSPVFNQSWDLIALHHAGGMKMKRLNGNLDTYPANEGLSFQSIRDAVAAKLD